MLVHAHSARFKCFVSAEEKTAQNVALNYAENVKKNKHGGSGVKEANGIKS